MSTPFIGPVERSTVSKRSPGFFNHTDLGGPRGYHIGTSSDEQEVSPAEIWRRLAVCAGVLEGRGVELEEGSGGVSRLELREV